MSRFIRSNRRGSGRGFRGSFQGDISVHRGMRSRGRGRGSVIARGSSKLVIEPHRHPGIYIAKAKEDMLVTKNMVTGESSNLVLTYFTKPIWIVFVSPPKTYYASILPIYKILVILQYIGR